MRRLSYAVGVIGGAAVAMAGTVAAQDLIQIDGSSTVYPITEAMAEEFQLASGGKYRVTVGISGTGGGFKKFCRGETHISDASRPIKESERAACKEAGIEFIELPVALDALTVMVNPENDWVDYLTVDELKKIWEPDAQGKVTNWSQVRDGFPDRPLTLYGAGVDSGTYDYFTEAVVGEEGASRGDFTASEDDNVLVQGIASDPNALGFFGLAYYVENQDKLKAVPIQPPSGGDRGPAERRDRARRQLSAAVAADLHLRQQAGGGRDGGGAAVRRVLPRSGERRAPGRGGRLRAAAHGGVRAGAAQLRGAAHRHCVCGGSQVGVAIEELLAAERVN